MKHTRLLLLSLSLLVGLACNLATPSTPAPTLVFPTAIPPTTTVNLLEPTLAALPTPTTAPTLSAKATTIQEDGSGALRIQFPPMGTWAEVHDTISAGASRQYILTALKGQTMSVSVRQGLAYRVVVSGKDGMTLTDPNRLRAFWRGVLPTSQDYFITVNADVDGDFDLRIAINPQELPTQAFDFKLPEAGLALRYTDEFAPMAFPYTDQLRTKPALSLALLDHSFYQKTNLSEVYLVVGLLTDATNCLQARPGEQELGNQTINGLTYQVGKLGDAAAGNLYEQTSYRTVKNNTCYEIFFLVHSGNIGNYPEGTVVEYDAALVYEKLMQVLKSLSIQ